MYCHVGGVLDAQSRQVKVLCRYGSTEDPMLRDSKRLDSEYEWLCCGLEMNVDECLMRLATKRIFLMPDNGGFFFPALSLISCPPAPTP